MDSQLLATPCPERTTDRFDSGLSWNFGAPAPLGQFYHVPLLFNYIVSNRRAGADLNSDDRHAATMGTTGVGKVLVFGHE